jgi:hypothetical protein
MRKLLIAVLLALPCGAQASPYFRPLDFSHPQPVAGALIDPRNLGQTEVASLLPLLTHSPKDGCLMPSIVCEDWTPLAVGLSMNAGKVTLDLAPLANVLPWMQRGVLAVVPDKWAGLRGLLAPTPDAPVTFSAGPAWQYRQIENKGYFKCFTGLALHF